MYISCSVMSDFCDPMGCSPPDSSLRGIFLANIVEWVTIPFSSVSS